MVCESFITCSFIRQLKRAIPFTYQLATTKYCKNAENGCAKDYEHVIYAVDYDSADVLFNCKETELEIFERKYCEAYKELHVRYKDQKPRDSNPGPPSLPSY